MSKLKVIGFIGKKGSGKNTTFDLLRQYYPDLKEFSFAGPLKEACSKIFNIPMNYFIDRELKEKEFDKPLVLDKTDIIRIINQEYGYYLSREAMDIAWKYDGTVIKTPRYLLQFIGTDVLRELDFYVHINTLLKSLPKKGIIGITDIRFKNEFIALRKHFKKNFKPIYLERFQDSRDSHSSEIEVELIKKYKNLIKIQNTSSIADLEYDVFNILERLL